MSKRIVLHILAALSLLLPGQYGSLIAAAQDTTANHLQADVQPQAEAQPQADAGKKRTGFGVIFRILQLGPEPVFQADGYRIRIVATTATAFAKDLQTLADVETGVWIAYEGTEDASGQLVAVKATFVRNHPQTLKAEQLIEPSDQIPTSDSYIDGNGQFRSKTGKMRLGNMDTCGWHRFPADIALQQRVRHLGLSVIPLYQQQLASNDPSKIHFRFYAIDAKDLHTAFSCSMGVILIPRQVADRLQNDDQLAAVLADGVALNLQWQDARVASIHTALLGAQLAGAALNFLTSGAFLGAYAGTAAFDHVLEKRLEQQRDRIALSLLSDSGHDPWQAPEAWRALESKQTSDRTAAPKYPSRSQYQLNILQIQYRVRPK